MAEKKQNFLHGATILAAGVAIMKVLGAIYKIPLGNLLGTEGSAYFNVAYNIYSVMLAVSTAGLPVALSRMISEANALGRPKQARKIFSVSMMSFIVLGAVLSVAMFVFPTELAIMQNMPEASQGIKALAPAVLMVCITSAYRGFVQGHSNMIPTTISQVLEVLFKVVAGLMLAWWLLGAGKSLPIASAGAVFGVTVGSLVAMIYMMRYCGKNYSNNTKTLNEKTDSSGVILKKLLMIGIPITLGASVMSVITVVDSSLVNFRLPNGAGLSKELSKDLYGTYTMLLTLYNLPAAFITPITISVVPAIAENVAMNRRRAAAGIAESSLRITALLALPMGIGLAVLSAPIVSIIYPVITNGYGPGLLSLLGVASFFVCIALTSNAILQAHGGEKYTVISMIIGGLVKVTVNWILVGNPDITIYGAPVGTICCYVVMCTLNWIFMNKCLESRPRLSKIVLRPAISSAVMGAAAWAVYGLASKLLAHGGDLGRLSMLLAMLVAIGVAVIIYFVMIIASKAITIEDMKLIPKGEKLAKLLRIK